ncbi:uncharacterized protein LOC106674320 [Cimex lectularius]|uniref:Saposin B-type domain-containing protein n=1 Tax=Cimex lectularius TaxID=79782 RepID=A0A8I6SB41_CIMLE|nr:uncharacterized protein LOC106674320 [Cimex lectularius]
MTLNTLLCYTFLSTAICIVNSSVNKDYIEGKLPRHLNYDVASKCEKCLACVGLALQLNETFKYLYENNMALENFPRFHDFCKSSFKKYGIKEFEGRRYFGQGNRETNDTNYISVLMKEKCDQLSHTKTMTRLFQEWKNNRKNLVPTTCNDKDELGLCVNYINLNEVAFTKPTPSPWWKRILELLKIFKKPVVQAPEKLLNIWHGLKKTHIC